MFSIRVDIGDVLSRINNLRAGFYGAVSAVEPVFGAFMPYSYYAEYGNRYFPAQPSVAPAINRNAQFITQGVLDRLMPALDKAARSGSVPALKQRVEQIWIEVLNSKPAQEARAAARYRTGAHRASIAGYATSSSVEDAVNRADKVAQSLKRMKRGK